MAKKSIKKKTKKKTVKKKTARKTTAKGKVKKKATPKVKKKKVSKKKTATKTKAKKKTSPKAKKKAAKKTAKKKKVVKKKIKKKTAKKATVKKAKKKASPKSKKKRATKKKKAAVKKATATGKKPSTKTRSTSRRSRSLGESQQTPASKGTNITLMVVDPYRLFVFWDADRKDVDNVVHNGEGYRTVIRVYIFEGDNESGYFDIRADHLSDEIYLDVIPDRGYMVEFGVIKGEQFTSLASSRRKFTPVFGIDNEDLSYEAFEMMIKHLPNGENRLSS